MFRVYSRGNGALQNLQKSISWQCGVQNTYKTIVRCYLYKGERMSYALLPWDHFSLPNGLNSWGKRRSQLEEKQLQY